MSPSATPATQSRRHCHEVPHLPPKVSIHATKCNACHAKGRVAATKRSTKASPASPCATPATQSGRHRRGFTATKRATRANPVSPSATLASMSPSTKIATQSVRRCHQVPCPAKGPQRHKSISAVSDCTFWCFFGALWLDLLVLRFGKTSGLSGPSFVVSDFLNMFFSHAPFPRESGLIGLLTVFILPCPQICKSPQVLKIQGMG